MEDKNILTELEAHTPLAAKVFKELMEEKKNPEKPKHKTDAMVWVNHLLKNSDIEGLIEMAEHCLEDGHIPQWAIQREMTPPTIAAKHPRAGQSGNSVFIGRAVHIVIAVDSNTVAFQPTFIGQHPI